MFSVKLVPELTGEKDVNQLLTLKIATLYNFS